MAAAPADYDKFYDEMLGQMPPRVRERIRVGIELGPELTEQIETLRFDALSNPALDQVTVQLIAFVVLLTQRAPAAVNHARAALLAGATREQLFAAVALSFVFGGLGPLNLGGNCIAELDAESAPGTA